MKLSYKYHTLNVPMCLLRYLKRRMRWVRAAGCVVRDEAGNLLLIRRNGRWDLPKGKVEPGETLLRAAHRETEEETGIRTLDSGYLTPFKTYHIFNLYGGWHLKQTSWFCGSCEGEKPAGNPQREEGITGLEWVAPDEWRKRLMHSYGTMKTIAMEWPISTK